jgi:uncharacterized protein HemX
MEKGTATIVAACIAALAALIGAGLIYYTNQQQTEIARLQYELAKSVHELERSKRQAAQQLEKSKEEAAQVLAQATLLLETTLKVRPMDSQTARGVVKTVCETGILPRELVERWAQTFGLSCNLFSRPP